MIQPSERDVLEACQDAAQRKARRLAAEDEGGEVGPRHRRMPTTAELEGKVPPQHAEPYGQAGAPPATNMKAARSIDLEPASRAQGLCQQGYLEHSGLAEQKLRAMQKKVRKCLRLDSSCLVLLGDQEREMGGEELPADLFECGAYGL